MRFHLGIWLRTDLLRRSICLVWNPELRVLKGPTLLILKLSLSGDAAEAIKTVAKNALARLP